MIHLPASVRVYLCLTACDMRKSFDGLHALVREHLQLDVFARHLFVFASRNRDRIKILYWDRDGLAVRSKRLEEGTYAMPFSDSGEVRREITAQELGALLSGIDLSQATRRKRYRPRLPKADKHWRFRIFFLGARDVSGYTQAVPVDPKTLPQDTETLRKIVVDLAAQLDRTERLLRQLLQAKTGRKASSSRGNSWHYLPPKQV